MDNLPNDPPDQNNPLNPTGVNPPQTPNPGVPNPPNSPSYPNYPNNPQYSIHSEVATHRPRDAHGHFLPYEHPTDPHPTPSNPSEPQVPHTSNPSSDDDPLFEAKVNNPFAKFFNWIKKLIKSEGINIKIKPLTAIGIALALSVGFGSGYGIGYNTALNQVAKTFFPNSSPIFHRPISLQGTIQKSESGQYYLSVPDNPLWLLKPVTNINLENVVNKQVTVKGNLTAEPNVINVTEVISFEKTTPTPATNSGQLSF